MSESNNKLPDKLSDMILLALADVEKVRANPRYQINMAEWHAPSPDKPNVCLVCFAGAVMAQSLGVSPESNLCPGDIGEEASDKLGVLNDLRMGDLGAIMYWPGMDPKLAAAVQRSLPEPNYYGGTSLREDETYAAFRSEMTALASWLSERGA